MSLLDILIFLFNFILLLLALWSCLLFPSFPAGHPSSFNWGTVNSTVTPASNITFSKQAYIVSRSSLDTNEILEWDYSSKYPTWKLIEFTSCSWNSSTNFAKKSLTWTYHENGVAGREWHHSFCTSQWFHFIRVLMLQQCRSKELTKHIQHQCYKFTWTSFSVEEMFDIVTVWFPMPLVTCQDRLKFTGKPTGSGCSAIVQACLCNSTVTELVTRSPPKPFTLHMWSVLTHHLVSHAVYARTL